MTSSSAKVTVPSSGHNSNRFLLEESLECLLDQYSSVVAISHTCSVDCNFETEENHLVKLYPVGSNQ